MTECHSAKVKLSDSQMNKLKSATKSKTGVTLRLSSDKTGTDENNILQDLLLTNRQFEGLCKVFAKFIKVYQVIKDSIIKNNTVRSIPC